MVLGLTEEQRLEACGEEPGFVCRWVADRTDSVWLTQAAELVFDRPVRILLILLIAFVVSRVLRSLIHRFGRRLAARSLRRLSLLERRTPRPVRRALDQLDRPGAVRPVVVRPGSTEPTTAPAVAPVAPELTDDDDDDEDDVEDLGDGRVQLRIDTLVSVLSSLATVVVWVVALLVVLAQFDISLAPLFAGAGVLGVALGFGAQSVVADFLSGFFMLFEDQFGVGDVVDVGEASGTVEKLSLRTTTLRDVNGTVWHIRNSEIRRVGNKSQLWSRAVLDIDVAYDSDVRLAQGIIQRVADELWRDTEFTTADIIEPPEVWGVENLGADGVTIRLVVKTDPADQWIVGRELRLRIKEALDEAGIEIPFPQRTLWIREDGVAGREQRADVPVAPPRSPDPSDELMDNPG